jgi:NAD(P)H-dependent FMN reductase
MPKIAVIIGSTREGRVTDRLATWVIEEVKKYADVEAIDLKDYPLPFFEEAVSPRYNSDRKPAEAVKTWLDKVASFDGYVLVTPEYNRATSGILKNALDFLDYQMEQKPVALVGHGTTGGAQAVGNLRNALPGVGAVTVPQAIYFSHRVGEVITEDGELHEEIAANPYGPQTALASQAKQLVWFAEALKSAKE